ncbi:metal ABC transporter ATP-binding protein [Candidatus Frankia meridionalis]|uniref:Phosphonate-transporting ATPase n=1 Tax=Candidatus Protofrankia datiscae TaxID=2716812 RepID=F8AWB4_9ACTN|nr:Phosphonate-transporting ATPase [Candidatus Protofrankia datiscae]
MKQQVADSQVSASASVGVGAVPVNADDSPSSAVVFDRASVAYGRLPVLEDVDGVVRAGHMVALIGPNGGGKSTLIKAILGLVPVVRGRIQVLGRTPARARQDVAYVPQADVLNPDFPVSVSQVVLMGRYRQIGWVRRPRRSDRLIAAEALAAVGLAHRGGDRFGTLSGGQRQRVLLARAMTQQPRLLLLDEPFNGVDTLSQQALLSAIDGLRAAGTTVVISTHDLSLAHLACDDVCLVNRHQFGFGPTAATLTPERLRAAYGSAALELRGEGVIVAHP